MHPGESSDAMVTWTAPWSGLYTFDITAILLEANLTCSGDGVLVYYGAKEATNQLTVTGAYPVKFPTYTKALSVRDTFTLRVNRNSRNFCDPTAITLIVTGPSPPAVSLTVSGPIVFDGPWRSSNDCVYCRRPCDRPRPRTNRVWLCRGASVVTANKWLSAAYTSSQCNRGYLGRLRRCHCENVSGRVRNVQGADARLRRYL